MFEVQKLQILRSIITAIVRERRGAAHLGDLGVDDRILLTAVLKIGSDTVEWFQCLGQM